MASVQQLVPPILVFSLIACGDAAVDGVDLDAGAASADGGLVDAGPPRLDAEPSDAGGVGDAGAARDVGALMDAGLLDMGSASTVCTPVSPLRVHDWQRGAAPRGWVPVSGGYLLFYTVAPARGTDHLLVVKLDHAGVRVGEPRLIGNVDGRISVVPHGDGAAVAYPTGGLEGLVVQRFDGDAEPQGRAQTVGPSFSPSLAADDRGFGVVYAVGEPGSNHQIFFRSLDADGRPRAEAIPLTDGDAIDAWPTLAWNGTYFAVAFHRYVERRGRTHLMVLDREGARVSSSTLDGEGLDGVAPQLASNGEGFALAFEKGRDGYLQQLDASGELVHHLQQAGGPRPRVIWAQTQYVFVTGWIESPVMLSRLTEENVALRIDRDVAGETVSSMHGLVSWDGLGYGVVWSQDRDLTGQRHAVHFARVCP